MSNRNYKIQGKGDLSLTANDFVAAGGQGEVFVKGKTAYKIYTDPKNMIPVGKIKELQALSEPYIVKPEDIILDLKGNPVGYTMRGFKKDDTYILCQVFPKNFRTRENFSPDKALEVVQTLQKGVKYVHSKGILIVDLNEVNFALTKDFKDIFFLDVDSYQTANYPAVALMPRVKDYVTYPKFTEDSDWFSFGVVAFQTFVGIHPFLGVYPPYEANKAMDKDAKMEARMRNNISVLNQSVKVPGATLPFDVIPKVYRDWFEAVFEKGKRIAPPDNLQAVIVLPATMQIKRQAGSDNFVIEELFDYKADVVNSFGDYIITTDGVYKGNRKMLGLDNDEVRLAFTKMMNTPIAVSMKGGRITFKNVNNNQTLNDSLAVDNFMEYGGRVYGKSGMNVYEVKFKELNSGAILPHFRVVANVMERSTQVFEGVMLYTTFGQPRAAFFPSEDVSKDMVLPELKGYQIVDAKFSRGVMIVVGIQNGKYDKLIYRISPDFKEYDVRVISDVSVTDINFTTLENGIVLHMHEDELEVFFARKDDSNMKVIKDDAVKGDVKLMSSGSQPMFARGKTVYKLNMKK